MIIIKIIYSKAGFIFYNNKTEIIWSKTIMVSVKMSQASHLQQVPYSHDKTKHSHLSLPHEVCKALISGTQLNDSETLLDLLQRGQRSVHRDQVYVRAQQEEEVKINVCIVQTSCWGWNCLSQKNVTKIRQLGLKSQTARLNHETESKALRKRRRKPPDEEEFSGKLWHK